LLHQQLTTSQKNDWTNTGQNQNSALPEDPDLVKIIEAWPQLSGEMKKAMTKMIS